MPAAPFRIHFAFRPARYALLERGQSSLGAVWGEAVLPPRRVREVCQHVIELMKASTKPNKPMRAKVFAINKIPHKAEKQTQARYQPCYQSLTAILGPILKKYEWNYERSRDVL